jgi:hypothetical protein
MTRLLDGRLQITLTGVPGRTYTVLGSADLDSWNALGTVAADGNGTLLFTDPDSNALTHRFYKLRLE